MCNCPKLSFHFRFKLKARFLAVWGLIAGLTAFVAFLVFMGLSCAPVDVTNLTKDMECDNCVCLNVPFDPV